MSGSSSPFSAVCDPSTSTCMAIRSSVDSISETNPYSLFTGCNVNSIGQEQSFQLRREYGKDFGCTWNQPVEQSNLSNVTIESHEALYHGNHTKKRLYPKEHGGNRYMGMKEAVGRSEQTSNSTVSKPASPISDESSGKHCPSKRLKADLPSPVHFNDAGSPEEQKPIVNVAHVSSETVQLEVTKFATKSPCCLSMEDSNADNNKMVEPHSEDVHNTESVRSGETHVSGETVQSENTELPTKSSCCSSMGHSCDDIDKMLEPGSEDVHKTKTFRSPEICVQTEEKLHCPNGDTAVKESEAAALDLTPIGEINSKKKRGASILYALTAEELRDHMRSLNQHICLVSGQPFKCQFSLLLIYLVLIL
jgi:E1A/CREB-binding protein